MLELWVEEVKNVLEEGFDDEPVLMKPENQPEFVDDVLVLLDTEFVLKPDDVVKQVVWLV